MVELGGGGGGGGGWVGVGLNIWLIHQELPSSENEPSDFDLESLHMGLKWLAVRISRLPSDSPRKV